MDLRFDVREFNTDMDALKRLEDALDVMQLNMHEALIATEQLEPKKAIALIKKAAGESRQAVFAWVWLKDRAASNNKFEGLMSRCTMPRLCAACKAPAA